MAVCCGFSISVSLLAADLYDTTWKGKQAVLAATKNGVTYAMNTTNTGSEYDLVEVRINNEGEIVYLSTANNQKKLLWEFGGYSSSVSIKSVYDNKYLYVDTKSTPKLSKNSAISAPNNYSALKFDTKTRKTFIYNDGSERGILMYTYAFKLEFTTYISSPGYPIAKPYFLAEHTWRTLGSSNFGTICFPKAVRADEVAGATFYEIYAKLMDNGEFKGIVLNEVTGDLVAGRPYIFKRASDATYIVAAMHGDAAEAGSFGGLVGTLTGTEDGGFKVPAGMYILQGDQLWLTTEDQSRLLAGRAYINPADITNIIAYSEASNVKGIVIGMDAPVDGVSAPAAKGAQGATFDLQGRPATRLLHGHTYLIDGRKVYIK